MQSFIREDKWPLGISWWSHLNGKAYTIQFNLFFFINFYKSQRLERITKDDGDDDDDVWFVDI